MHSKGRSENEIQTQHLMALHLTTNNQSSLAESLQANTRTLLPVQTESTLSKPQATSTSTVAVAWLSRFIFCLDLFSRRNYLHVSLSLSPSEVVSFTRTGVEQLLLLSKLNPTCKLSGQTDRQTDIHLPHTIPI